VRQIRDWRVVLFRVWPGVHPTSTSEAGYWLQTDPSAGAFNDRDDERFRLGMLPRKKPERGRGRQ